MKSGETSRLSQYFIRLFRRDDGSANSIFVAFSRLFGRRDFGLLFFHPEGTHNTGGECEQGSNTQPDLGAVPSGITVNNNVISTAPAVCPERRAVPCIPPAAPLRSRGRPRNGAGRRQLGGFAAALTLARAGT